MFANMLGWLERIKKPEKQVECFAIAKQTRVRQLERLNLAFVLSKLVGVERGEDLYPSDLEYWLPDKLQRPLSAITP